jgi:hypothetical protein
MRFNLKDSDTFEFQRMWPFEGTTWVLLGYYRLALSAMMVGIVARHIADTAMCVGNTKDQPGKVSA